jgi:hypothetical protein
MKKILLRRRTKFDMNRDEKIWSILVLVILLIGGLMENITSHKVSINEASAYEAIEKINGENFNDLVDQEDAAQKINVCFSIEYPEDKQVIIFNKKNNSQSTLFIENNNGLAKVVDVDFYGKQDAFNKYR